MSSSGPAGSSGAPESSGAPITISPAIPIPIVFNKAEHVARLKNYVNPKDPHYQGKAQEVNIKKLIQLYESGEREDNSTEIFICKGEIVSFKEAEKTSDYCYLDVSSDIICH